MKHQQSRKLTVLILSFLFSLLMLSAACAAESGSCGNNLTWVLNDEGVLTVSGTGTMPDYAYPFFPSPWNENASIKKVIVENGVANIGASAFFGCEMLSEVTLAQTTAKIGSEAFSGCIQLKSIGLPNGVAEIGMSAFNGCTALSDVLLPDTLAIIEKNAFEDCKALKKITIPGGVSVIGPSAFSYCDGLTSAWIRDGVTRIGEYAFVSCRALEAVSFPDTLTTIEGGAFTGCFGLKKVYYAGTEAGKAGIQTAGDNQPLTNAEWFFNVTGDPDEYVEMHGTCGKNLRWTLNDDGVLTVSGTGAMEDYTDQKHAPWYQYSSVRKVVLEKGVTRIGDYAFDGLVNMTKVSIPDGLEQISQYAFSGCAGLTEISIPDGLDQIGQYAFSGCAGLTEVMIPKSVLAVGRGAFSGCSSLSAINVASGNLGGYLSNDGVLYYSPSSTCTLIQYPAARTAASCTIPEEISKNKVTAINDEAFSGCTSLVNVSIPLTVTRIGKDCFSGCTSLKNIYYSGSETGRAKISIESGNDPLMKATWHCAGGDNPITEEGTCGKNLHWTLDEDGVLTISGTGEMDGSGDWDSGKVKSIVIRKGLSSIPMLAFSEHPNLRSVTIEGGVESIAEDAFFGCNSLEKVSIGEGLTGIKHCAFEDCRNLTSVSVPKSLASVEKGAFQNCWNLKFVYYAGSKAQRGAIDFGYSSEQQARAQEDTNLLKASWHYAAGVPSDYMKTSGTCGENMVWKLDDNGVLTISGNGYIGDFGGYTGFKEQNDYGYRPSPFRANLYIREIVISEGVTGISINAFIDCAELTSVSLPASLQDIRMGAFSGCYKLKDIQYAGTEAERKANLMVDNLGQEYIMPTVTWHYMKAEDEDKITAFVRRCYKLILNRDPDQGGLTGWSEALKGKTAAAANIIDGFVKSDEFTNRKLSDGAKVDILYQTMLNRKADKSGKAGWVDALGKGYTLQHIINGFCASDEFTALCKDYGIEPGIVNVNPVNPEPAPDTPRGKIEAFVKRCYKLILNRDADQGGLQGWSEALESGAGQACQIIDGFVRSPEYINRNLSNAESVDILYQTMLNRVADEGGKAGWVDALEKGYTLQHIINGFCGSAEFTNICNEFGITAGSLLVQGVIVKREAIAPEGEEEAPVVYVNYSSEFTNEEKVRAFVEHCYEAAFGRVGDAEGVEAWTKLILDGKKTPKRAAYEFIFSDEFQSKLPGNEAFIRILYKLYLNREPNAEELAGWIAMLENGTSLEDIVNGFAGSAEFKAIVNSMKE